MSGGIILSVLCKNWTRGVSNIGDWEEPNAYEPYKHGTITAPLEIEWLVKSASTHMEPKIIGGKGGASAQTYRGPLNTLPPILMLPKCLLQYTSVQDTSVQYTSVQYTSV